MEKSRFLAEGEPSKLSESFLDAGVTFLDKLTYNILTKSLLTSYKLVNSQLVCPLD